MVLHTQKDEVSTEQQADNGMAMTLAQKRFYASDNCINARMKLQQLVDSPQFNTDLSAYDGKHLGFVDRHLYYLSTHSSIVIEGYISNLKLMTRIRSN